MGCCHPSHSLPKFPLRCNVWRGTRSVALAPDVTALCQLHLSAPSAGGQAGSPGIPPACFPSLYLPPLTDIRGGDLGGSPDVVEVPAGSKRYYQVYSVDDVAKGFPNEFRIAVLAKRAAPTGAIGPWPYPTP